MGMEYKYGGSASYPRFTEEINKIDELVRSDDPIFVSWIADPYKELTIEDTKYIYGIIINYTKHNPTVELPYQPLYELECCVRYNKGWHIYE